MISSRCRWISVYLPRRTAHALNLYLSCNLVSIGHVNCPAVIRLPHIAVLSSFGRETSLVNIMRLRSILPSLVTSAIYFSLLFTIANIIYHYYHLRLILCELQGRRD